MMLSAHFSLDEMCFSESAARFGITNYPLPEQVECLKHLCVTVMEPIRERVGQVFVSSGFRSVTLNQKVGGSAVSAHCCQVKGKAACDHRPALNGRPLFATLADEVDWLASSDVPFDQAIYEFGRWVHVSTAAEKKDPRKQLLMAFRGAAGGTIYMPWDRSKIDAATGMLK